ncbi:MAG: PCRF domain-containing protein, partial [Tissierellia bacterium]|nr:PCRF domain-containing protein [Tissierellia bacterium]
MRSTNTHSTFRKWGGLFDVAHLEEKRDELEEQTAQPDFWSDVSGAQGIISQLQGYRTIIDQYRETEGLIEEAEIMLELVEEENSFEYLDEIKARLDRIGKKMEKLTLKV